MFIYGASLLDRWGMIFSPIAQRISYADILFCLYLNTLFGVYVVKSSARMRIVYSKRHKYFLIILLGFAWWTGLSWVVTTLKMDGQIQDFFGITVRISYYIILSIFVTKWAKNYGINDIVTSFCAGVLTMFYFNFFSMALTITDIPIAINVNNFSGVLLPVISVYFSLSLLCKPSYVSFVLCCLSYLSCVLVFSLGGYILMILAFPAVLLSCVHFFKMKSKRRFGFLFSSMIIIGMCLGTAFGLKTYQNTLITRIKSKFANIPINSEHIQSGDVRWGHFLSSMLITMRNPIFGVGEYNWERENDKNRNLLGEAYHQNENPHNAIAQIFSMFGLPAGILFGLCLYYSFVSLYRIKLLNGQKWIIWVVSVGCVFLASANLMDTIFTTYYFYFFAALVFSVETMQNRRTSKRNVLCPVG
jgi:hypothetical protein